MKAILISTHPQWVEKILNGIKKDEIRKGTAIGKAINKLIEEQGVAPTFIYCTKKDSLSRLIDYPKNRYVCEQNFRCDDFPKLDSGYEGKGKVVARFNATAEKIYCIGRICGYQTETLYQEDILGKSCLLAFELDDYLQGKTGTAIHINDLEIFDKPKELSEFKSWTKNFDCVQCTNPDKMNDDCDWWGVKCPSKCLLKLTRSPQSWCYVEL